MADQSKPQDGTVGRLAALDAPVSSPRISDRRPFTRSPSPAVTLAQQRRDAADAAGALPADEGRGGRRAVASALEIVLHRRRACEGQGRRGRGACAPAACRAFRSSMPRVSAGGMAARACAPPAEGSLPSRPGLPRPAFDPHLARLCGMCGQAGGTSSGPSRACWRCWRWPGPGARSACRTSRVHHLAPVAQALTWCISSQIQLDPITASGPGGRCRESAASSPKTWGAHWAAAKWCWPTGHRAIAARRPHAGPGGAALAAPAGFAAAPKSADRSASAENLDLSGYARRGRRWRCSTYRPAGRGDARCRRVGH